MVPLPSAPHFPARELLWQATPFAPSAREMIQDKEATISVDVPTSSELYGLICDHIAKSGAASNYSLGVTKGSKCCGGSQPNARLSAFGLGLGCFAIPCHGGTLWALHTTLGEVVGTGCGPDLMKSLVLFGPSTDMISRFVNEILELADRVQARSFTVYRWHVKYGYWMRDQSVQARPIESVVLPRDVKERMISDMEEFEAEDTQTWYREHGIPYKRSYLFYGVPGSGKTSLIQALAGKHGRNVCYLSPTHPEMTDDSIKSAVQKAPARSIVILEDVDALFTRTREKKVAQSPLTFSGLLNALDGVGSSDGQVFVLTTNLRDELDEALIRNGRVDMHIYFGHAEPEQMQQLFSAFYPSAAPEQVRAFQDALSGSLGEEKVSMAALQHFFILQRRCSAEEAIKNVGLVKEELARRVGEGLAKATETPNSKEKGSADKVEEGAKEEKVENQDCVGGSGSGPINVHVHLHGSALNSS